MSLAIIRTEQPYKVRTAHFLHTQEDSKDCCYKIVVKKLEQDKSCNYLSIKHVTVATYYAKVISAVHEALEIHQDCFVEVHINER